MCPYRAAVATAAAGLITSGCWGFRELSLAQSSGLLGADLGVGGVDFTRIPPFLKLSFGTN